MPHDKKPLILVDGSSYLFRAYHALPPLTNSYGEPSGALYGVINMLKNLVKQYEPSDLAVVFDTKSKNFRHKLYPAYKANRPPMPEELASQIQPLHQTIKALGMPLIAINGIEADDVIGTLAQQAADKGMKVLISTGDKDMAQLVTDDIHLINTMTNSYMDINKVNEKFGVPPEKIIDYLSLIGDTVDNIPGVNKVGPKTAVKLLNEYQSLQGVIDNADSIKGKLGENVRAALQQLPLSKQLVTINKAMDIDINVEALQLQTADNDSLKKIYAHYEFKKWLADINDSTEQVQEKAVTTSYEMITTNKQLVTWLDKLKQADVFAFDTETTSLDYMQASIVGISIAVGDEAAYIPLAHDYEGVTEQLDKQAVLNALKPILEDPQVKVVGQNLKYDIEVLANEGINLGHPTYDTMLESYILDSQVSRHDMNSLALTYLNRATISYEDVAGKGTKQIPFSQVTLDNATQYAAEDADITLALHQHLWQQLNKDEALKKVFLEIEMPLVTVLASIERQGVLLDTGLLQQQGKVVDERLQSIKKDVYAIAEEEFNINSTKQLQAILYDKLKLPVLKKTPKGQPSTAEAVLQELALDYPLPKMILEYRSLSKLKSTYIDALPQQIDKDTGRVHTSYHQAVTATGRLSSSNPNLQNIPVRTEEGRKIRQAFIANKGFKIMAADYSQIELRIMAHLSKDKGLLDAFAQGLDVHKATAAEVFGTQLDAVTSEQRRHAKAINFGLIYGMSAFGLSRQLGLERDAAQTYIDRYFDRYPGVKQYMDRTTQQAHQQGYVETLFGRRLYLPNINSKNFQLKSAAERAAINAPLQGTAADIIKIAMIKLHQWLQQQDNQSIMIMQVHDELVFEVHQDDIESMRSAVNTHMTSAANLDVELIVDIGVGDNWDEAH